VSSLDLKEEVDDDVRLLRVAGAVELGTAERLDEPLARAASDADRALIVDLTSCEFIDSVGLATLIQGAKPLQNGESNVAFVVGEGMVKRLLALTAVDRTIPVFDTVAAAREAILDPS
jgi:anti-sigma B factor antagonist